MLDVTKPVRYSNYPHDPAVILTTERPTSDYPIVSMNPKTGELFSHRLNGAGPGCDLENGPEEVTRYFVASKDGGWPNPDHAQQYDPTGHVIAVTFADGKVTSCSV